MNYQSTKVTRSLFSTGQTYVDRMITGSDSNPVGLDTVPISVPILNGRLIKTNLDANGFTMISHISPEVDYYDEFQILNSYYPECCRLIKNLTGAKEVFAFDHNIRSSKKNSWLNSTADSDAKVRKLTALLYLSTEFSVFYVGERN